MQTLYVMCGIPGSGKSTLSKQIAVEHNLVRFSLDEMRYVRQHKLIPHILDALQKGKSVVADSLYTKRKWRIELLESVKNIGCKCILLYMSTPFNECISRNNKRENVLPNFMIESIYNSMEIPTLDEGWDDIILY